MITFKQFLTEEETFDIETFKKDCAFVLKQSKGGILWHGSKTGPADFEVRKWKPRTAPRNSPDDLHTKANQVMTQLFDAPVRNWMFVTGWKGDAQIYSDMKTKTCFMIFPIGKFEWVCSTDENLRDMTTWHTRVGMEISDATKGNLSSAERDKLATAHVTRRMPHVKWEHNTNLPKCIASHNEIMIKCDTFYIVNERGPAAKQIKALL